MDAMRDKSLQSNCPYHGRSVCTKLFAQMNPLTEAFELFPFLKPEPVVPVEASDGTLWQTAAQALVWDMVTLQLERLRNGQAVRDARLQLRLSRSALAAAAGISQSMLVKIEGGERRFSDHLMAKVWGALWRIHQQSKTLASLDVLVRLENSQLVLTERFNDAGIQVP